jgi:hypothetical protein
MAILDCWKQIKNKYLKGSGGGDAEDQEQRTLEACLSFYLLKTRIAIIERSLMGDTCSTLSNALFSKLSAIPDTL